MDQNQTVDNDLQKAIDNITNTTDVDPVFSDPVAAPSSVPEGDTGELGEPVGPFPEPKVEMVTPQPEPIAPLESMDIPELNNPSLNPTVTPPATNNPPAPTPTSPAPTTVPEPAPSAPTPSTTGPTETQSYDNPNVHQIKEAALRDLIPLIDRLKMTPSQKFHLYRDIFEDLRNYTVLEPAYQTAKEIPDETERAQALLYLVEAIDKM